MTIAATTALTLGRLFSCPVSHSRSAASAIATTTPDCAVHCDSSPRAKLANDLNLADDVLIERVYVLCGDRPLVLANAAHLI